MEREDRGRREAGEDDDGAPAARREADRLARLQRNAVRHDPWIGQLGDDPV